MSPLDVRHHTQAWCDTELTAPGAPPFCEGLLLLLWVSGAERCTSAQYCALSQGRALPVSDSDGLWRHPPRSWNELSWLLAASEHVASDVVFVNVQYPYVQAAGTLQASAVASKGYCRADHDRSEHRYARRTPFTSHSEGPDASLADKKITDESHWASRAGCAALLANRSKEGEGM